MQISMGPISSNMMRSYSSFNQTKQDIYYNKLVEKLIQTLQSRLVQFYKNGTLFFLTHLFRKN